MIVIRTPSRLHFGLLSIGQGRRQFGGAGLAINLPGVEIRAYPDERQLVHGQLADANRDRYQQLLDSLCHLLNAEVSIEFIRSAAPHVGLGSGTQASLAIADAVSRLVGQPMTAEDLAEITGRGHRSAIGVHGYKQGGFLVDGGKTSVEHLAPLVVRHPFPPDWPVVLIRPNLKPGLSGAPERAAFADGLSIPSATTDHLCRILLLEIAPALVERDYVTFAEALARYNRIVGECFASVQGGPYADPLLAHMIEQLQAWEVLAVGQSSWGPTLFAILPAREFAPWLLEQLSNRYGLGPESLIVTAANNIGAEVLEGRAP